MMKRESKSVFYALAGPAMRINGWFYRNFRAPRKAGAMAHLGPGQKNYLTGWINVDANMFTGKCDVWSDLRNALPFRDSTLQAIYSHHVVEHLPDLAFHFHDAFRCLAPGGVYRVGGPNGDSAIKKFAEKDASWFGDFPDRRESLGGKLENFIFCRGEHLTILTFSYLEELMRNAGFVRIRTCLPMRETGHPKLFEECLKIEHETDFETPATLIVEAEKPASP